MPLYCIATTCNKVPPQCIAVLPHTVFGAEQLRDYLTEYIGVAVATQTNVECRDGMVYIHGYEMSSECWKKMVYGLYHDSGCHNCYHYVTIVSDDEINLTKVLSKITIR
jgi:hypothetical protein